MTPREVLLRAAELVERGWTQRAYARDASGESVGIGDGRAVCWCAAGAVDAAAGDDEMASYGAWVVIDATWMARGETRSMATWNDAPGRTQAEVVQALRAAAETCT